MKILIMYWSAGGNTRKVAETIKDVVHSKNMVPHVFDLTHNDGINIELYDFDLIFFGSPSYQFIPPKPVLKFIEDKMLLYEKNGKREVRAPVKPEKKSVVFCTYAGIHTGYEEGETCGKYMKTFLKHLGFRVLDEWYTVGKFHEKPDWNKNGKLGDISGRPDDNDIKIIHKATMDLLVELGF